MPRCRRLGHVNACTGEPDARVLRQRCADIGKPLLFALARQGGIGTAGKRLYACRGQIDIDDICAPAVRLNVEATLMGFNENLDDLDADALDRDLNGARS